MSSPARDRSKAAKGPPRRRRRMRSSEAALAVIIPAAVALCVLSSSPSRMGGGGGGGGEREPRIEAAAPTGGRRGGGASGPSAAADGPRRRDEERKHQKGMRRTEQKDGRIQANQDKQEEIRPFRLLSSAEISERLHGLAGKYADLCTLTSSQELYGLPSAGGEEDCAHDHSEGVNMGADGEKLVAGCKNWILEIEDKVAHPKDSGGWRELPEVFLSGALHGDERVGPTAVTEAAGLLLESAACEALPRRRSEEEAEDPEPELGRARECRADLARRGVADVHRRWMARLVATRRIVVVPTANALGYDRHRRREGNFDPNRDFPYDLTDPTLCMQTVAGRTINEIFRDHVFQLSITFHAGMEAVAYEWGAPTYLHFTSPDDVAQAQIASGYSRYAGGWENHYGKVLPHKTGTMNDVVYPVRGGMEDWAYAASWDPDRVLPCEPRQFGGYPPDKTMYDEATLRALNMLVETSNFKTPREGTLGTTEDLFSEDTEGNGHVSRNVRLALLAIDLVEPYASVLSVDGVPLSDDVVPLSDRSGRKCVDAKAVRVPPDRKDVDVEWTVGGGFTVDETVLLHAKWSDLPDAVDGASHPRAEDLAGVMDKLVYAEPNTKGGRTRWHADGPEPPASGESGDDTVLGGGPVFRAAIDITSYIPGDRVAVFAVAKLDQSWSTQPPEGGVVKPAGPPQSHVVRARTDPEWSMKQASTGKIVMGRYDWYSIPVTLFIGEGADGMMTVELSSRFNAKDDEGSSSVSAGRFKKRRKRFWRRHRRRRQRRRRRRRRFKPQRARPAAKNIFTHPVLPPRD